MTALYVFLAALGGVILGYLLSFLRNKSSGIEPELRHQIAEKDVQISENRARENILISEKSAAVAERDAAREGLAEKFRALSAEALAVNQTQFLGLANENFAKLQETAKGDLIQKQAAIDGLLKPLEAHLKTYQERLQQSETTQSTMLGSVQKQIQTLTERSESLAKETEQFRAVLKSSQARGRWGEETLRRVIEEAGMDAHFDFTEQTRVGDSQPDLVMKLPGGRTILIDAKAPDLDFLSALETTDPEKRKTSLEEHASKLKLTIKALADRDYPSQFKNSFEHVILFLPAESLFSAALEGDRDIMVFAKRKKILLATPTSLFALVNAIKMSWDQFTQNENTREIAEAAQKLYDSVLIFADEHLVDISAGLERANKAFNKAVGTYGNIKSRGEKLRKLGVGTGGKDLPEIEPTETALRLPIGGA